jgi:hypothetical protein
LSEKVGFLTNTRDAAQRIGQLAELDFGYEVHSSLRFSHFAHLLRHINSLSWLPRDIEWVRHRVNPRNSR